VDRQDWCQQIQDQLQESGRVKRQLATEAVEPIFLIADAIARCLVSGGKILLCGNGGSAADCQHLAAEFVGRLAPGRERRPLRALALTTDTSALTALGNDYGFDQLFSRQLEAIGTSGDLLVGISTSGDSHNVVLAVEKAKELGLRTVGFLGGDGGKLKAMVDLAILVPSQDTARIQEAHIAVGHVICDVAEGLVLSAESNVDKQGRRAGAGQNPPSVGGSN
jgi:D-sedoheptulose 7-phosphate isomerase